MPGFLNKLKGTVIINDVDDDQVDDGSSPSGKGASTNKNNKKNKKQQNDFADMSHEERQEKKAELKYKKNPTCFDRVLFGKKVRLMYVVILCLSLGLVVPYILTTCTFHKTVDDRRGTCAINISYRFNCQPGETAEENACHTLGCCYDTVKSSDLYAPTCFHSIPSEYGYSINNTQDTVAPRYNPLVYRLESKEELSLNITPLMEKTNFNTTAWSLQAKVERQGNDVVRILLWCPENNTHFNDDFKPESGNDYKLDVIIEEKEGDFNITVVRVATNETLMETVFGPLIYGEKYMEITTRLPTYHLYGLGQRYNYELIPNFKQRESWALFNREEDIKSGATYGSHPFYMNFEKSGNMFGVYLKNSAPVEVGVVPVPGVVFRGVGGVLDFRIMAGPKPIDVTEQYTKMVGRPTLPPRWSLGYHLCRTTLNQTEYNNIVKVMKEAKIPYESDCIDARLSYPDSFASLPAGEKEKVDEMKLSGRKFFMVQYPFVSVGSQTYNEAKDLNVFMKLNATMDYFGSVNKTTMVYPDYVDNNTIHKWLDNNLNITNLYNLTDGILLLRNSPLNDVQLNYHAWDVSGGPNCTASTPENCCPSAHLNFHPGGLTDINNGTLCWEALHPTMMSSPHLELHNAYGRYHHMRVHEVMKSVRPTTRPLVMSQSTQPGSGALGGHFGGYYLPDFVSQKKGLVQVLEMGLYGVPLVGVPICGSINDTKEELRTEWCLRGHQSAAFWPFMMSYNEYGQAPRNPPNFEGGFTRQLTYFIRQRYMILPYLYTLFYQAHLNGAPVARPLFYEFPGDMGSREISSQFLLGEHLLVSPVFQSLENGTSVQLKVHFPPGCWYNWYSGSIISDSYNGTDQTIATLLSDLNVNVRGGAVIPLQGRLENFINTTADVSQEPFYLLVALTCPSSTPNDIQQGFNTSAKGMLYVDDGITPVDQNPPVENLDMKVDNNQLSVTRLPPPAAGNLNGLCDHPTNLSTSINKVIVYGAPKVTKLFVDGAIHNFTQTDDTLALHIKDINYDWCVSSQLNVTWV